MTFLVQQLTTNQISVCNYFLLKLVIKQVKFVYIFIALLIFLSLNKFLLLCQSQVLLFFSSFNFLLFETEQFTINYLIGLFPVQSHLL